MATATRLDTPHIAHHTSNMTLPDYENIRAAARTSTAWLEFTPSDTIREQLGEFIIPDIRQSVMANLAIRSSASAQLNVVPSGGSLMHDSLEQRAMVSYSKQLERMRSHQFPLSRIEARKTNNGSVKFSFTAQLNADENEAITSFEPFNIDRTAHELGVYALLPLRYITPDNLHQEKARLNIMRTLKSTDDNVRRKLYISNPRWAERINFENIKGDKSNYAS
ncbi:MAG TPA: hypothetical protein VFS65_00155 [Candidatus Saccharimonadales bacterium]|nr:hypothetical protein [Candidatus Saccharimonadales bacterium]